MECQCTVAKLLFNASGIAMYDYEASFRLKTRHKHFAPSLHNVPSQGIVRSIASKTCVITGVMHCGDPQSSDLRLYTQRLSSGNRLVLDHTAVSLPQYSHQLQEGLRTPGRSRCRAVQLHCARQGVSGERSCRRWQPMRERRRRDRRKTGIGSSARWQSPS